MNKKLNLSIIILCIIEIICGFTPFCLYEDIWSRTDGELKWHNSISFFENGAILGIPLAILFVCSAIVVAIIYFLKMSGYATKVTNKAWIFAVAHTATMAIFLLYSCFIAEIDEIAYKNTYGINWMSYIIIALNLIVLTLSFSLKMEKTDKLPFKKKSIKKEPKESVGDLPAYKELLDSGVISQEEFDAKKKQILGL